jgi:hypothetical protein
MKRFAGFGISLLLLAITLPLFWTPLLLVSLGLVLAAFVLAVVAIVKGRVLSGSLTIVLCPFALALVVFVIPSIDTQEKRDAILKTHAASSEVAHEASRSEVASEASGGQADPKVVTLTDTVKTEYGLFGAGRQMPFIAREGDYVRVSFLEHEVLIPLSSTDLCHGCSKPSPDDEEQRQTITEAVLNHRVVVGMTAEQCRMAWGNPLEVNRTLLTSGKNEQWVYAGNRYLYIDNGILTSIQD